MTKKNNKYRVNKNNKSRKNKISKKGNLRKNLYSKKSKKLRRFNLRGGSGNNNEAFVGFDDIVYSKNKVEELKKQLTNLPFKKFDLTKFKRQYFYKADPQDLEYVKGNDGLYIFKEGLAEEKKPTIDELNNFYDKENLYNDIETRINLLDTIDEAQIKIEKTKDAEASKIGIQVAKEPLTKVSTSSPKNNNITFGFPIETFGFKKERGEILLEVCKEACDSMTPLLREIYNLLFTNLKIQEKKDDDTIFTIADGLVQYFLKEMLFKDLFAGIVGEEDVKVNIDTGDYYIDTDNKIIQIPEEFKIKIDKIKIDINILRKRLIELDYKDKYIFIDPIDSTKEFQKGQGFDSTICIGFSNKEDGKAWAGIVYRPIPKPKLVNNELPDKYSVPPDLVDNFNGTTFAYGCKEENYKVLDNLDIKDQDNSSPNKLLISKSGISEFLVNIIESGFEKVPTGGAGNKMLYLLEGKANAYIQDRGVSRWDTCAAQAIIEAVGGVCCKLTEFKKGKINNYTYKESSDNLDFDETTFPDHTKINMSDKLKEEFNNLKEKIYSNLVKKNNNKQKGFESVFKEINDKIKLLKDKKQKLIKQNYKNSELANQNNRNSKYEKYFYEIKKINIEIKEQKEKILSVKSNQKMGLNQIEAKNTLDNFIKLINKNKKDAKYNDQSYYKPYHNLCGIVAYLNPDDKLNLIEVCNNNLTIENQPAYN